MVSTHMYFTPYLEKVLRWTTHISKSQIRKCQAKGNRAASAALLALVSSYVARRRAGPCSPAYLSPSFFLTPLVRFCLAACAHSVVARPLDASVCPAAVDVAARSSGQL